MGLPTLLPTSTQLGRVPLYPLFLLSDLAPWLGNWGGFWQMAQITDILLGNAVLGIAFLRQVCRFVKSTELKGMLLSIGGVV